MIHFLACAALALQAAPQAEPRDIHGDPLPPDAVARLGRLTFGHYRDIYGNALSGDGKTLATGGCDESIRIWDVPSGRLRRIIDTRRTFVIALTADGSIMASASSHDKATRIHDTRTGAEIGKLDGEATSLSFSPDGKRLAAAFARKIPVRVYDASSFEIVLEFPEADTARHNTVVFFEAGKRLATAGADKTLRIWDAETGGQLRKSDLDLPAYKIVPAPDSRLLALTCVVEEGVGAAAVLLFDATTGAEVRRLEGHTDMVLALSFTSDSKSLLSAGKDRIIRMWDVQEGKELETFAGHRNRISGVHVLPGNEKFLSTSDDRSIRLWGLNTGLEEPVRPVSTASLREVAWSPDGTRIVAVGYEGRASVWEAMTGKELLVLKGHEGIVSAVAWSPDGTRIATAGQEGTVRFWDAKTGASVRVIGSGGSAATSLAYSPDGAWLAGTGLGIISSWNAKTGDRRFQQAAPGIAGDMYRYPTVAYSADGESIAVAYQNGLRVYEAAGGGELLAARGNDVFGATFIPGPRAALAFPCSVRFLAILESDRPWSGHSASDTLTFSPHSKNVHDLGAHGLRLSFYECEKDFRYSDYAWGLKGIAVSGDGRYLAAGHTDGSIRVFESFSGLEVKKLKWHYGSADRVAFSPDGSHLASVSWGECTAMVWNLRPSAEYRAADLEMLWKALLGTNGSEAFAAANALAAGGASVAQELTARLLAPSTERGIDKLVADLDHDNLDRREEAETLLRRAGLHSLAELRRLLAGTPSAEARRRAAGLVAGLEGAVLTDADAIRRLRTLAVLERLGAVDTLGKLSRESPSNRERRDAAAALKRLAR